jgi:hypothetical protein
MPYTSISESFRAAPVPEITGKPKVIARNTFRYQTTDGHAVTRLHMTDIETERL